jgi:tetratricopeptide (TPR) repeat protein
MNVLLAATSTLALALAAGPEAHHHHSPQLGSLSFETTCAPAAQAPFIEGLGWLHSFEYDDAARSFSKAAEADHGCAIAEWGVAMSYYHPLWVPPTAAELEKGRAAIAKATAAGAGSQRERDYIGALGAFYRDSDRVGHKERALAYSAEMEQLHQRYPQDREAGIFYALTLIAAGTLDKDPEFTKEKQAAAILNSVLKENPDHPGVAHYLIHNFDYPALAELALPAARRYASIAPASAHAQHMPSHIFTRLGLWDEVIQSNLASEAAAKSMTQAKGFAGASREQLHAMDYLAYAYLQTGRDGEAKAVLAELNAMTRVDEPVFSVAYAATAIPVRLLLERRRWREAASLELPENLRTLAPLDGFKWAEAHIHFARAMGAARSGNPALARDELGRLAALEQAMVVPPGTYDWRKPMAVERQTAEAWLARGEGKPDEALRLMQAAADLDDATEKHPVTPGSILPAREQLGELLLELGRPNEALAAYEASLKRAPRRLVGLHGAAKAAKLAGDSGKAGRYYAELIELTKAGDGSLPEVKEARVFTAELAKR